MLKRLKSLAVKHELYYPNWWEQNPSQIFKASTLLPTLKFPRDSRLFQYKFLKT